MVKELLGSLRLGPVQLPAAHVIACMRGAAGCLFLCVLLNGQQRLRLSGRRSKDCWCGLLLSCFRRRSGAALAADSLAAAEVGCSACFWGGAVCLGVEQAGWPALYRRGHCEAGGVLVVCCPQRLLHTITNIQ